MEYNIRKLTNGYVVILTGDDPLEGYITKEFVFLKYNQVVKFVRDHLAKGEENS